MNEINTHDLLIEFGKHKGERWTRLPLSYIKWLANTGNDIALAELKRRGSADIGKLEISGHAIDRASVQLRKVWHKEAIDDQEGIHSWLHRRAVEADDGKSERVSKNGIIFIFVRGELFTAVKTVMRDKVWETHNKNVDKVDSFIKKGK